MSKRIRALLIAALIILIVVLVSTKHDRGDSSAGSVRNDTVANPKPPASREKSEKPLTGELILQHYAEPSRSAEEDLTEMAHALDNFALLVKGNSPIPLGANEEIANALKGRNRVQMRFLPDTHRAFNPKGQIIDRWGTPLFFHANDRTRLDIRSAGPDQVMWTADDLHRKHDGSFLRGETLLSPSLFEATANAKP